jgi:hypothetical protein
LGPAFLLENIARATRESMNGITLLKSGGIAFREEILVILSANEYRIANSEDVNKIYGTFHLPNIIIAIAKKPRPFTEPLNEPPTTY